MKLEDRERVGGTSVTIGRRVYYRNNKRQTSKCYAAEYRDLDGKQMCRNLGTKSRGEARRKAIEIQQELESGIKRPQEGNLTVQALTDRYEQTYEARGLAQKTRWKYAADLDKLRMYCVHADIRLGRDFTETHLCLYRKWLEERGHADKTVEAAIVLAKQVFKWTWRQRLLNDYRFSGTSFPKAKARPQPCFTSEQVKALIIAAQGEEKTRVRINGLCRPAHR
jgi:hypothetical protein